MKMNDASVGLPTGAGGKADEYNMHAANDDDDEHQG